MLKTLEFGEATSVFVNKKYLQLGSLNNANSCSLPTGYFALRFFTQE